MNRELWTNVRLMVAAVQSEDFDSTPHVINWSSFLIQAGRLVEEKKIFMQRSQAMPLDFARSQLAQAAANPENGFTHMFMYDCDMDISLEIIEKLLSRGKDVVSGTYFMAGWQKDSQDRWWAYPCVAQRDKAYVTREEIKAAAAKDALIEVHGTGAGCLMVTAEALRAIGNPAFEFNWNITNAGAAREGEDYFFCRMARASGYTVYMDPTVIVDHYKYIRVGMALRDMNGRPIHEFE